MRSQDRADDRLAAVERMADRAMAAAGVGVLMISSDLEEILGVSDRVLVMHQGELAGDLAREQMSEQAVMHLATGGAATGGAATGGIATGGIASR